MDNYKHYKSVSEGFSSLENSFNKYFGKSGNAYSTKSLLAAVLINYIIEKNPEKITKTGSKTKTEFDKMLDKDFIFGLKKYISNIEDEILTDINQNTGYTKDLIYQLSEYVHDTSGNKTGYGLEKNKPKYRSSIITTLHDMLGKVSLEDIGQELVRPLDIKEPLAMFKEYRILNRNLKSKTLENRLQ